ncbi:hypothetical protein C8035_v006205 [Colletotrichum spinosum]|uniref:F-box domain-containing protein n=1 Tax=Colletotrichum spinosum TaxID=1347390 RepID=A0A4R8Q3W9_9PEZI|nr:hypothetical protein C8035_v006205 [Colletotrichum spinosum]
MAENTNRVSFEDLPTEVLLDIFSYVPDVPALHSLILASPNAFRAFQNYGPEIIEHVFDQSVFPEILFIMRRVALIRQSTLENTPEEDSRSFFKHHVSTRRHFYARNCGYEAQRRDPALTGAMSFTTLLTNDAGPESHALTAWQFLKLTRSIALAAHDCLTIAFDKCIAAKPSRPLRRIYFGMCHWEQHFESEPVDIVDVGRPSWLEMQRMMRGFWRFQLLGEIQDAILENRLSWTDEKLTPETFDAAYVDYLVPSSLDPSTIAQPIVWEPVWGSQFEEFVMAREFTNKVQADLEGLRARARELGILSESPGPVSSEPKGFANRPPEASFWPKGCQAISKRGSPKPKTAPWSWQQHLEHDSPGYRICKRLTKHRGSPLCHVPQSEFRNLGFFIWDAFRLRHMGLLKSSGWKPSEQPILGHASNLAFTWRSYFADEVIRRADLQSQQEWEREKEAAREYREKYRTSRKHVINGIGGRLKGLTEEQELWIVYTELGCSGYLMASCLDWEIIFPYCSDQDEPKRLSRRLFHGKTDPSSRRGLYWTK